MLISYKIYSLVGCDEPLECVDAGMQKEDVICPIPQSQCCASHPLRGFYLEEENWKRNINSTFASNLSAKPNKTALHWSFFTYQTVTRWRIINTTTATTFDGQRLYQTLILLADIRCMGKIKKHWLYRYREEFLRRVSILFWPRLRKR